MTYKKKNGIFYWLKRIIQVKIKVAAGFVIIKSPAEIQTECIKNVTESKTCFKKNAVGCSHIFIRHQLQEFIITKTSSGIE